MRIKKQEGKKVVHRVARLLVMFCHHSSTTLILEEANPDALSVCVKNAYTVITTIGLAL